MDIAEYTTENQKQEVYLFRQENGKQSHFLSVSNKALVYIMYI